MAKTHGSGSALTILICFAIAALEGYDIQAFGVSAPKLAPALGLDQGQIGWAASAAMIGLVIGAFAGGWAADRVGRRPVLVASVAAFGVFSIVTAYVQSFELLLLARLATGLGFGGAMPNLIAVATEISPPNRRAATVTMMFCGMPAGGATVALVARFAPDIDWRMLFLIGGLLPILLVPVVHLFLPETRPAYDPRAERRLAPTLFGGGRAVGTILLWMVFMLTLVVLYLMLNWLPSLVIAKGLTPQDGSAASLAFNLTSIAGALLLGFVVDRAGFRWPLAISYLLLAAVMLALSQASGLTPVLVLSGVAGFLILGAQYSLYAVAPSLYPPQVRAAGAGAAVGVGRLGSIAGPLLAGELRQIGWSADQVFAVMAPVVVAAAAGTIALGFLGRTRAD